jgi:hypothetical protein
LGENGISSGRKKLDELSYYKIIFSSFVVLNGVIE